MMTSSISDSIVLGQRVGHPDHGLGTVRSWVRGGRAALVRFDQTGTLDIQVSLRELTAAEPLSDAHGTPDEAPKTVSSATSQAGPGAASPLRRGATGQDEPAPAPLCVADRTTLQLLEALRLGTVPASGLDLYTVGRESEMAEVERDLDETIERGGSARVILGDYGSGKTHLLECIGSAAQQRGFLVGRAALDPADVPASNPRRVYRRLMHDLVYPGSESERGLMPLLEAGRGSAAVAERFLGEDWHPHLSPTLRLLEHLEPDDAGPVYEWLEGAPQDHTPALNSGFRLHGRNALPAMMDYRPWAHIYSHLISGIAALAHAAGHRGMVVMLDEAELFRVLDSVNRAFAIRLFRALMAAALPASGLPFDPAEEPRGGRGRFRQLPHRWTGECPLYVVLAMTPTGAEDQLLPGLVPPDRVWELSAIGVEDYRALARKIIGLYAARHPALGTRVDPLSTLIGELMHNGVRDGSFVTPRSAVKFVLDLLDMARLMPEWVRPTIEEIKQLWYDER